jgi:hypothetical protein
MINEAIERIKGMAVPVTILIKPDHHCGISEAMNANGIEVRDPAARALQINPSNKELSRDRALS